ncbi:MAG: hypothetical protein JWP91_3320 [Fibrobacteres bacterium]|nr:hypothetical protein [Fibrobacterota bacterium]
MFLFLILLQAPAFGLARIWEANLARPMDFLSPGAHAAGETSTIPYPEGDWTAIYSASLDWTGLARREGASFGEVASGSAVQAVWARPAPMLDLALTWSGSVERNRYIDPGKLDLSLGGTRAGRGLAVVYHLALIDLGLTLPDVDRQAYAWMLAAGRNGPWRIEYSLAQRDVDEPFTVANLDSNGSGERVQGSYRMRSLAHRMLGRAPLAGGSLALMGTYAEGAPERPEGEFWLSDSSRSAEASASYERPFSRGTWGRWRIRSAYRECEALTLGRRMPPGSEGLKRFHYARNHGESWEAGAAWSPGKAAGLDLGGAYRDYAWTSTPSADALDSRNETLSYNRLGLSFIANVYGGLFKAAEIVSGSFHAGAWEAHGDWAGRLAGRPAGAAATGWGGLSGTAGLSLYRADFRLRTEGHSLTQRVFSVDTSAAYGRDVRGFLIGATPRLGAAWTLGRFRFGLSVSQIVPMVFRLERDPNAGGETSGAAEERGEYPLFRNGFSAQAGLQAGY